MRQGKYMAGLAICTIAALIGGCGKDDGSGSGGTSKGSAAQQSAPAGGSQQTATGPQASAQAPAGASGLTSGGVPTAADLSKQAEQNREILTKANQGKEITSLASDTLKTLLPETLAGMKRTGASAEKNQMMGIDMSKAEGDYEGQDGASINLTITDVGNLSGPMKMGMTGWTMAQYNRETDNGYEKTATYSGYKGMEEYNKQDKSGTIRVFVADRFVVELDGRNVTMDALKQALDQVDIKKVASMASGS